MCHKFTTNKDVLRKPCLLLFPLFLDKDAHYSVTYSEQLGCF